MHNYDMITSNIYDFDSDTDKSCSLGWLKLYFISSDNTHSSRTIYVKRNSKIYAVLHTDTTGGTKTISLPASESTGTNYRCVIDNGESIDICIYPFVMNVHYIDK